MFKRLAVLMMALMMLAGAQVLAQVDDPQAAIPACTAGEKLDILNRLQASGALDMLQKVTNEAPDLSTLNGSQLVGVLQDANALQVLWHQTILPSLPDCALTYRIDRTFGQWTDETTLTMSLFEAGLALIGNNRTAATQMVTMAQDHTARMATILTDFSTLVNEVVSATPSVEATAAVASSSASPLTFSGNGDKVIGPVTIPRGIYRARVTTAQSIIIEINPISGECGQGTGDYLSTLLFSTNEANGAEAVLTSRGCQTLIAVSLASAPWTLEFEKIG